MTVTATRLGSSPITLDWSNLVRVPAGSAGRSTGPDPQLYAEAWAKLKQRYSKGEVGYYDCPISEELTQIRETLQLAQSLAKTGQFTDCLFLGIGGSALGPISLLRALPENCESPIRFHFMENPDPVDWKCTIQALKPDSTLVCLVTKSGTTFETLAQGILALNWLGRERWKSHVVAITDPAKGDLKKFAAQEGIPTLHIAPSMGGRFSIFTPVGLFPAALAGLSVEQFMLGAKQVRDYVEKAPLEKNAIFLLGHELIRHSHKRPIHVCMPYSSRLRQLGAWFAQLWGESLGKDGKGFTPLAAVGPIDQHSILQLLRDGPDDKITWFMTVDEVQDEVRIPKAPGGLERNPHEAVYPAFKILENHTLHELMTIEYRATSLVLANQGRPNLTFQLDRLDERSMGAVYFMFSVLTAFTGSLWNIDPFNQPGVEEGKIYIREALGRGPSSDPSH